MTAPLPLPPLHRRPLHDSGPLFSPRPPRRLGESALLRVRVPASYPVDVVALRAVIDGEIRTSRLRCVDEDPTGAWWETELRAENPVVRYRFCLLGPGSEDVPAYAWLTAAGLVPWDVSDATDFRLVVHESAPDWVADAIVYQVFPDRFARSASSPADSEGRPAPADLPGWAVPMRWDEEPAVQGELTARQLFGGDLDGVIEHLDHVASLGADTLYLTPVFPAGSVHRYDASTFDRVDPLLGGDEALVRLSAALHARGMRLLLDLTTNHTGDTHEWFRAAQADPASPEAGFYLFTDHPSSYRSWLDAVPSLPKLDLRSPELRRRLVEGPGSVVARYLREPLRADGWRIDVANMTGRHDDVDVAHDVARSIRATLRALDQDGEPSHWLLAEHGHDASADLAGDGWHGTMNYTGFTRPLWAWLTDPASDLNWLGLPTTIPRLPGQAIARTIVDYGAQLSWSARQHSQNQLASHDTPRTRSVVGTRERQIVAVAALAALPGVPTLFAGDELGARGTTGEHSRTPMPWEAIAAEDPERIDTEVLRATRALLGLRRQEVALRQGGLALLHAADDVLVLARTHPDGDVVVVLARAALDGPLELDLDVLPGISGFEDLHAEGPLEASSRGTVLVLRADGPGAVLLRTRRP
ncbi:glycoside hydrolase family 13 protein [Brachybacterium hainanense]|uniref:Glycoside hydrolase family 13 protein n=1 Tax=Brachybacterium hainanense TaxID=1541174 RepID=A0ABV6RBI3_9MICO